MLFEAPWTCTLCNRNCTLAFATNPITTMGLVALSLNHHQF
jgi:hypothetical protein